MLEFELEIVITFAAFETMATQTHDHRASSRAWNDSNLDDGKRKLKLVLISKTPNQRTNLR